MKRTNNKRKRSQKTSKLNAEVKRSKNTDNPDLGEMIRIDPAKGDDIQDWNMWVAATATRNYLLDDGILDVLKTKASTLTRINTTYQDKYIKTIGNFNPNNFVSSIMQQGVKFEKKVIRMIHKKIGKDKVINIGGDFNPRSQEKYLNTVQALNDGWPVIYQGVLRNYSNSTYGIPDLIVRSDYLHKLVKRVPIPKSQKKKKAPKLQFKNSNKYHYVIIDIKFKTLHLKSDGIHLRNDGPMKAYKSQLCVYNEALGFIQGYQPPATFIMGWKWKYVSKTIEFRGNNCFDRLGRIDYLKSDKEYVKKTSDAINWVLNVRKNSHKWDLSKTPLIHEELYPNMCNRYDHPYHKLKKKFAEDIDEISLVWRCGPKERRLAHKNKIYSWKDKRCTPDALGIGGKYTGKVVSRILEANRSTVQNIFPRYITNNFANWKNNNQLEFFVDFETTCSVFNEFDNLPNVDGESLIFMIGVGYVNSSGTWIFKDFTLDRLDVTGELKICSNFVEYINNVMLDHDCFEAPALYHWSHAETTSWKRACERHIQSSYNWMNLNWVDLLKVFQTEPIGIKGCLNYGLKNVAKTFHKHGYIKTIWDSGSSCVDGADAAVCAYRVDKETRKRNVSFRSDPLAQEIIKYNEVDCKVLQEIIQYLRDCHIDPNDPDLEENYYNIANEEMDISSEIVESESDDLILHDSDAEGGCGVIDTESLTTDTESYDPDTDSDDVEWYEYNSISEDSDDDSDYREYNYID